jgi:O-antigen/teichoic acid export membrane protein
MSAVKNTVSSRKSILRNGLAAVIGKGSTVVYRFIQVPLFLGFLGVEGYGKWLLLSSIPSWLSLANMGFGTVASNEVAVAEAGGDLKRANEVFSTTIGMLLILTLSVVGLVALTAPFLPVDQYLRLPSSAHQDVVVAIVCLSSSVAVSFLAEPLGAKYRVMRKVHVYSYISSFRPWADLALVTVALALHLGYAGMAAATLLASLIYLLVLILMSSGSRCSLHFGWKNIKIRKHSYLLAKGAAYQAFPIGNALQFQGSLLILGSTVGAGGVALYSTVRTLVRSANQMLEIFNQMVSPEMSILLGANQIEKAARLHRMSLVASICLAILAAALLFLLGIPLYRIWTSGTLSISPLLLFIFCISIPIYAGWYTSSLVAMAFNRHEGIALRYLMAAVLSTTACYILSRFLGLYGAALSVLVFDLFLFRNVIEHALRLTDDTMPKLLKSIPAQFGMLRAAFHTRQNLFLRK